MIASLESSFGTRLSRALGGLAILASITVIVVNITTWPFSSNGPIFQVMYAGSLGLGALGYLVLQSTGEETYRITVSTIQVLQRIQAVICFGCIGALLLVLDDVFYLKPPLFYLLVSIWGTSLIGITVISRLSTPAIRWWILGQTIALGLVTVGTTPAINPYLTGPDAYWHFNRVIHSIEIHHLTEASRHYYYYFVFHLVSIAVIQLAGSAASAFSLLTVFWGLAILPAIYVLVRTVTEQQSLALVSSQLLVLNTPFIFGIIEKSPTHLGLLFIISSIYVIFKSRVFTSNQAWGCFVLLGSGAFFSHFVTSIALAVFLFVHFGYQWLAKRDQMHIFSNNITISSPKIDIQPVISPILTYIFAFVLYHVFIHPYVVGQILVSIFGTSDTSAVPSAIHQSLGLTAIVQYGFGFLGIVSLLFFVTIGGLQMVRSLSFGRIQIIVWFGVVNVLGISYLFLGSAGESLRLILLAFVISVIPAAIGIQQLTEGGNGYPRLRYGVLLLVVFSLAFAGPASYLTWDGNEVFNDEINTPTGYARTSLLATHDFLTKLPSKSTITMDSRSAIYLVSAERGLRSKPEHIDVEQIERAKTSQKSGYTLVNEERWEDKLLARTYPQDGGIYTNGEIHIVLHN